MQTHFPTHRNISKNKATQTEDSKLFIMCYDHIQVQHEENLIATNTLENIVDHFNESLTNILKHSDMNFQILAYQIGISLLHAVRTDTGVSNGHPSARTSRLSDTANELLGKPEQIPNLHIEHYAIFKQHELQDTDDKVQCQVEGTRPKTPPDLGHYNLLAAGPEVRQVS